jgi:putative FmdB family regulatory protein
MPIYSFKCAGCDSFFDERVAVDRRDEHACPVCHGPVVRQTAFPRVWAPTRNSQ